MKFMYHLIKTIQCNVEYYNDNNLIEGEQLR